MINVNICSIFCFSEGNQLISEKKRGLDKNLEYNQGFISSNSYELFWFIQISDTQFLWYSNQRIADFYEFLNETYKTITPLFIYNTGDLVNTYYGAQQNKDEWELYKKALDDNSMNTSIYMDVIGNHDAMEDPNFEYFLNYSMMGISFNTTQYSFNKTFNFGNYAFIGLNTAKKSYNLFEFGFQGFLSSEELDWYENELEKYKEFEKIFVFGHHPPSYPPFYKIISEESSTGKDFYELNEEHNVSYYFSGHIHSNSIQYLNELLSITTSNFDQNNGVYRIISLDNNSLSTSVGYVGVWPQAIITHPSGEEYLFRDLYVKGKKIRVLAWDPKGIISVKWGLFDNKGEYQIMNWQSLEKIYEDSPLWEGNLDFQYRGNLLLKVKIDGGSGETLKILNYNLKKEISVFSLSVAIIMVIGLISISVIINYYLLKQVKKK
ncbi:MAG: metallophosphoesterase family protein [Candidatus Hodarchaeota archaeon]